MTLWKHPAPQGYLSHRGLAAQTLRDTLVGYATGGSLVDALRAHGLPLAVGRSVGLLDSRDRERLRQRVVVPVLESGTPVWMIGRSMPPAGSEPRYLSLPGPKPLLGWDAVAHARRVCIVEGVIDYLVLRQWDVPVLALLGTHARPDVVQALTRFDRVDLALDNDPPGRAAATALSHALGSRAMHVALPHGIKDVADLALVPGGRACFASVCDAAWAAVAA